MKLKEKLRMLALVLALPVAFVACDSNDDNVGSTPFAAEKGIYVFNAGNQAKSVEGSLSFIDDKTEVVTNNVFKMVNERSLGSTVQDGVVLGNNLYIAVSKSNTIEVVNKNTLVSVVQIKPDGAQGNSPRDIVTDGKYVYVSMMTGHISRINPSTNTIDKTVSVGPNPEEMAISNGYLYVVNSDGNNYNADYVNGKSVSKVSLSTFLEEKKIAIGLNPTKIVADASGNLIAVCMGNYLDVPATLWKINSKDEAVDMGISATLIAVKGNSLYVIDAPYGVALKSHIIYNTVTGEQEKANFVSKSADAPAGLAINPSTGTIYITSYNMTGGKSDASIPGYVNEYSADGTFVKKYDVGVGAVIMAFLN